MINAKETLTGEIYEKNTLNGEVNISKEFISPPLIDLEVNPSKEQQVFNHEDDYGYDNVIVNSIPEEYIIPSGSLDITENGTKDVTSYAEVNVNIEGKEDLTEELNTYNTELTEQETKIADVIELLQTKATPTTEKYAPRCIRFSNYKGTELDYELSNLDTSNIISFNSMFSGCINLTTLDLSNRNISNVTDMANMFTNCSLLTSVKMQNLDASAVTQMNYMFYDCKNINSVDFSNSNTSNVSNTRYMFYGCDTTTSLEIKGLDTSNVTDTSSMFYNCKALTLLDIRSLEFTKVTTYSSMFGGVPSSCVIVVKNSTVKSWINSKFSGLNVKTVAELEG